MLFRFIMTLIYACMGVLIAFPASYWFQDGIYHEMTWGEYIDGGMPLIQYGAQFGAIDVYRKTLLASMIIMITLCRLLEWWLTQRYRAKGKQLGRVKRSSVTLANK